MAASVAVEASHDDVGRIISPAFRHRLQMLRCLSKALRLATSEPVANGKMVRLARPGWMATVKATPSLLDGFSLPDTLNVCYLISL